MGLFSKLFKGPAIDMEKSNANAKKMRALFNQVVEDGDNYHSATTRALTTLKGATRESTMEAISLRAIRLQEE